MVRTGVSQKVLFALLAAVCLLFTFAVPSAVLAEDTEEVEKAFADMLEKLKKDGIISSTEGKSTYWGDYTDEWAQIGWYQWITFEHSNRFVFSANVSWESASQTPNNFESGCGLILFNDVVIPFVDRYPTDTKTYKIMNTKPEEVDEPVAAAKQGDDADGEETE